MSTITLDNIPAEGTRFFVYATATRVNFDEAEDGVAETGWVDLGWNDTDLYESRNDVMPAGVALRCEVDPDDDDADTFAKVILDAWREALRMLPTTIGHDNGDGTYYGDDHYSPRLESGDTFTYALHAQIVGPMNGRSGAKVWDVAGLPKS